MSLEFIGRSDTSPSKLMSTSIVCRGLETHETFSLPSESLNSTIKHAYLCVTVSTCERARVCVRVQLHYIQYIY